MFNKLVIVDYLEGAGGEYISYFISSHAEFLSFELDVSDMQTVDGNLLKYLNSQSIVDSTWDQDFKNNLLTFIDRCTDQQISAIAVPYHLYKWPSHAEVIKNQQPGTRFIKINYTASRQSDISLDFFRKVWFKKFNKSNLPEIKFLTENFSTPDKQTVVQRLQANKLYYLDLVLLKNGVAITSKNRQNAVSEFQNQQHRPCPSNDIVIEYDDFFVNFDRTLGAYKQLCGQLKILPDMKKLDKLIERNKKNYLELQKFATNFQNFLMDL